MSKVFAFPNLAAPIGQPFNSFTECLEHYERVTVEYAELLRSSRTKSARRDWFRQAESKWPCISFVEGLNPHMRVGADNPPHLLHGIAADFDAVNKDYTDAELRDMVARVAYPPAAGGSSLSGNGYHFVWFFEEPVQLLGNEAYAIKVIKHIFSKIRVGNLMVGLDDACKRPTQLLSVDPHTFGWLTEANENTTINAITTRLWAGDVDADFEFDGIALDLEAVKEQVDKSFPGRWVGPFVSGARGTRFWDPSASDPTAAVVTPTGMRYFSNGGGFATWAQIFGADFVDKLSIGSIKAITDDWFYDRCTGEYVHYFRPLDQYGKWNRRQFNERMALDGLKDRDDQSRAAVYVEQYKAVDDTVALANQASGIIHIGTEKVINIRPTTPPKVADGPFEFIRALIMEAMFPGDQGHYLCAWLKDSVRRVLEEKPSFAQALFMVGDVALGKSLLQQRIFTPLFGGIEANPMPSLTNTSAFNGELAKAGHWCVNDAPGARHHWQQQELSQHIKTITTTTIGMVNAKYKQARAVTHNSRISFSLNRVVECLQVFPRLGDDVLDKLILLDVANHTLFTSKTYDRTFDDIVADELPGFAHWLLNVYEPPEFAKSTNPRYYATSYKHPEFLTYARAAQIESELLGWLHELYDKPDMAEYRDGTKRMKESAAGWLRILSTVSDGVKVMTQQKFISLFNALAAQHADAFSTEFDKQKRHYVYSVDYSPFR